MFNLIRIYPCPAEFNEYNDALFNIRARSLNNLVYWLSQIVGSISIGFLLDQRAISRRIRAFSGWTVLLVMVFIVHVWAYFYQKCVQSRVSTTHLILFLTHMLRTDSTREHPFLQTQITSSISLTMVTLHGSGSTFFVVFWMLCGKQPHTGSWAQCQTTLLNSPISRDSVRKKSLRS